jgi:acyl carrier protein
VEHLKNQMVEIFEIDDVQSDDVLREYELWDSLSVISLLAVLDEHYGINIEADDLAEIETAGELMSFVEQRRSK